MRARWRRWAGLTLVGGLLALSVWREWPRERLLLQHATRIADADDFVWVK
jgi:hypothetical protein